MSLLANRAPVAPSAIAAKAKTYVPKEDPNYNKSGLASWYGSAFHGRNIGLLSVLHAPQDRVSRIAPSNSKKGRSPAPCRHRFR